MIFRGRKAPVYVEDLFSASGRIRVGGRVVDLRLLCRRVDKQMRDEAVPRGGKVTPLRTRTIDDGEIRLGPVRVEPLTAEQETQAVELLAVLFSAAVRHGGPGDRLQRAA